MKYSTDDRIQQKVRDLIAAGWTLRCGGAHPKLIAPCGRRISVITTPSDRRSALNWLARVRRIEGQA